MLFRKNFFQRQKGFTLIELMIVIAIISILAAIAIPQFNAYRTRSMRAKSSSFLGIVRSSQSGLSYDIGGFGSSTSNATLYTFSTIAGDVLDAGISPIPAATNAAPGIAGSAQLCAQSAGSGEIMAFPIDVPGGIVAQVSVEASPGNTYSAVAFAFGTNRVFALDFDSEQTIYYDEQGAFTSHLASAGGLPPTMVAVGCNVAVNDPATAGYFVAFK